MLTVWDWQKKSKIAEIKVVQFFNSFVFLHISTLHLMKMSVFTNKLQVKMNAVPYKIIQELSLCFYWF